MSRANSFTILVLTLAQRALDPICGQVFLDEIPRSTQNPLEKMNDGLHDMPPYGRRETTKSRFPKNMRNHALGEGAFNKKYCQKDRGRLYLLPQQIETTKSKIRKMQMEMDKED